MFNWSNIYHFFNEKKKQKITANYFSVLKLIKMRKNMYNNSPADVLSWQKFRLVFYYIYIFKIAALN